MANYAPYASAMGGHTSNLPPPGNPSFMSQTSTQNAFTGALSLGPGFGGGGNGVGIGGGIGLASHDAQLRFHGGSMQSQPAGGSMYDSSRGKSGKAKIREVWKGNLCEEFEVLRQLVDKFPYISMVSSMHCKCDISNIGRTPSFQESLRGLWDPFVGRVITTIRRCDPMSTFSS